MREFEETNIVKPKVELTNDEIIRNELSIYLNNVESASSFILKASAMLEICKHDPFTLNVDANTFVLYSKLYDKWETLKIDIMTLTRIWNDTAQRYETALETAVAMDNLIEGITNA